MPPHMTRPVRQRRKKRSVADKRDDQQSKGDGEKHKKKGKTAPGAQWRGKQQKWGRAKHCHFPHFRFLSTHPSFTTSKKEYIISINSSFLKAKRTRDYKRRTGI